jgi:hypothetical protein
MSDDLAVVGSDRLPTASILRDCSSMSPAMYRNNCRRVTGDAWHLTFNAAKVAKTAKDTGWQPVSPNPWPAEAASPSNTQHRGLKLRLGTEYRAVHGTGRPRMLRSKLRVVGLCQPCPGSRHPRALHDAAVPGRSGRSDPGSRWNCRHIARAAACGPLNTTRRLWFALPPRRSTRPWLGFAPRPRVCQFSSASFWPAGRQEKRFGVPGHRSPPPRSLQRSPPARPSAR